MRADARRNRDRLLEAAVHAFSQYGPDVPLDTVAKDAGVGIGTLYRHFPTRGALVEAAYRNELARLCESAAELIEKLPADQAMRAWMDGYVDYMSAKRGMAEALRALIASGTNPYAHTRTRLTEAIAMLVRAGAADGTIRPDIDPEDILVSLSGVTLAAGEAGQREQAGRLLDLITDGLRYTSKK